MAHYPYWNCSYFRLHEEAAKDRVCARQIVVMFLLHLAAYGVLYLKSGDSRAVLFYLAQVIFFGAYLWLYRLF